jgi:hypothetical protein
MSGRTLAGKCESCRGRKKAMADVEVDISPLFPGLEVVVDNPAALLTRVRPGHIFSTAVPLGPARGAPEIDLRYSLGERHDPRLPRQGITPWHDIRRVAAEALVVSQIYHRLGVLLHQTLQASTGPSPSERGESFFYDPVRGAIDVRPAHVEYLFRLEDPEILGQPSPFPFDVYDISVHSPSRWKSKARGVMLAVLLTGAPAGPPAESSITAAMTTISTAAAVVNAANAGYQLYTNLHSVQSGQAEIAKGIENALAEQLAYRNGRDLQTYLALLGRYDGPIDGEIGSRTLAGVAGFAKSVGLDPHIHYDNPLFLRLFSLAVAERVTRPGVGSIVTK